MVEAALQPAPAFRSASTRVIVAVTHEQPRVLVVRPGGRPAGGDGNVFPIERAPLRARGDEW